MPGFNGSGPLGQGPMTGRGLGRCTGAVPPGAVPPGGFGLGMGRGFRGGRGWGPGPWAMGGYYPQGAMDPADEKTIIENQIKGLQEQLDILNKKLEEMSS